MKPALHHYILAHTASLSIVVGVVGSLALFFSMLFSQGILNGEWDVIGWIILAMIPVVGIGGIIGATFIWMILGEIAAGIQGWPFAKGDEVVILSGKNKGRIVTVYEVLEPRGQVLLELGEDAKKTFADVYCAVAVTRIKNKTKVDSGRANSNKTCD